MANSFSTTFSKPFLIDQYSISEYEPNQGLSGDTYSGAMTVGGVGANTYTEHARTDLAPVVVAHFNSSADLDTYTIPNGNVFSAGDVGCIGILERGGTYDTCAVTSTGRTWVQIATVTFGSTSKVHVFRSYAAGATSGDVNFAFTLVGVPVVVTSGVGLSVRIPGADTSGTDGSGAVVQFKTGTGTTGTSGAVALDSALEHRTNANVVFFCTRINEAIVEDAGYTEITADGAANNAISMNASYQLNDTGGTWSWATSGSSGWIAVEFKSAPA